MGFSSIPSTEIEKKTMAGPNWIELPRDVTANILKRLGTIEILTSACQVCPSWWNICKDPHMWRTINMTKFSPSRFYHLDELVKICRKAIERSCGQVEEIEIHCFATDDLLAYIAESAGHLRHMRLTMCRGLSDKGFRESVKKLPQLESLDISSESQLSKDTLEVVGRYCPLLKTLKCSKSNVVVGNEEDNDVSFAIAKTMPGLHHLKICGNMHIPTNHGLHHGLLAILDGCPLLESLDLKGCYYYNPFDFSESLEKRCREKIKDFLPPTEQFYSSDYDSGWDCESEYSYSSG